MNNVVNDGSETDESRSDGESGNEDDEGKDDNEEVGPEDVDVE